MVIIQIKNNIEACRSNFKEFYGFQIKYLQKNIYRNNISIDYNIMLQTEILEISDIIDDIKQNITDYQYKSIMDLLMKMNKTFENGLLLENEKLKKQLKLFNQDIRTNVFHPIYLQKKKNPLNTIYYAPNFQTII